MITTSSHRQDSGTYIHTWIHTHTQTETHTHTHTRTVVALPWAVGAKKAVEAPGEGVRKRGEDQHQAPDEVGHAGGDLLCVFVYVLVGVYMCI